MPTHHFDDRVESEIADILDVVPKGAIIKFRDRKLVATEKHQPCRMFRDKSDGRYEDIEVLASLIAISNSGFSVKIR